MAFFISVLLHETFSIPGEVFSKKLTPEYCLQISRENSSSIQIWQEFTALYVKNDIHFWSHLDTFVLELETFQIWYRKSNHTFYVQRIFSRKSCLLRDNVGNFCTAIQVTDDNMAHALWMLNKQGCRHTLRISFTYRFSPVTVVAQTRINVTLQLIACIVMYNSGHN